MNRRSNTSLGGGLGARTAPGGDLVARGVPGQHFVLRRFENRDGWYVLGPPLQRASGLLVVKSLPVGSYLLETAGARYPVVIRDGVEVCVRASPPRQDSDFTWIPETVGLASTWAVGEHEGISSFLLRTYPVTRAEYAVWLRTLSESERRRRLPRRGSGGADSGTVDAPIDGPTHAPGAPPQLMRDAQEDARPVVGICWEDAHAYCSWAGCRLPTAGEYRQAIQGVDGRSFPWGDNPDVLTESEKTWLGERESAPPIGRLAVDESPYGVRDLVFGVRAWTSTEVSGGRFIACGGCWSSAPAKASLEVECEVGEVRSTVGLRPAKDLR